MSRIPGPSQFVHEELRFRNHGCAGNHVAKRITSFQRVGLELDRPDEESLKLTN
jgi:hypothetical protein